VFRTYCVALMIRITFMQATHAFPHASLEVASANWTQLLQAALIHLA
jgi:hypothetical protein